MASILEQYYSNRLPIPQAMRPNNPTGVIDPRTGQPYIYASPQAPVVPPQSSFLSSNNNSKIVTQAETQQTPAPVRSKYIDPSTGKYFQTPQEYGNYVATKIPASKANGDIPRYAGDAMTNPNRSAVDLEAEARNLNNARNDIAVGKTDPYKVGNQSGIAYSPQELNAIEKAYAGIYDPALNDVFARLKEKQAADAKITSREEQIFATNESIRQWKATTGSKVSGGGTSSGGSGSGSGGNAKKLFTQTQLNNGARNAGMTIDGFSTLDEDLQNFFVQPPSGIDDATGKTKKISEMFQEDIAAVKAGTKKTKDVADAITNSTLPDSVKHYYIDQLPLTDVEKQGFFSIIWEKIKRDISNDVRIVGSIFGQ